MTSSSVIVLSAEDLRRAPAAHAWRDLAGGLRHVQLWGAMAWFDIRQRYSRSLIGPFWTTLSLGLFVAGLGLVYGALFKIPLTEFLPYLTVGMLAWQFISGLLVEGCTAFVLAEVAIKQMPVPLSVHIFRLVWRTLIILGHNAVAALLVLLVHPWNVVSGLLPALVGLAALTLNGVASCITLGTLGARFRDLQQLLMNVVAMLFFVTPILWQVDSLGDRSWIAYANPVFHLIEIIRAPLLGLGWPGLSWAYVATFTILNGALAFLIFARFRARIPYWL